jgi:uncharacterized protein YecA (UPF0149 family)
MTIRSTWVGRRGAALVALCAALLVAAICAGAASASPTRRPVPGSLLVTPRAHAFLLKGPVRVVVRVPAKTTALLVDVDGRPVSARFRRAGKARRIAYLRLAHGVRYGRNHLVVEARRRALRPLIQARTFVLAPRRAGLARLRVTPGPVTAVRVRINGANSHQTALRMWLNGHEVSAAAQRSGRRNWTASLSATQWLRYGANRIRVQVVQHRPARWVQMRRSFTIARTHPLAAAGWDGFVRAGTRTQLNATRSLVTGSAKRGYSWRIVSQPRGSHVRLRNAHRARPSFLPRRPGRYTISLKVSATPPSSKATPAPLVSSSSIDRVTEEVTPKSLLLPFKVSVNRTGDPGVHIGDSFFANQSPDHQDMQLLVLDRSTLTVLTNSWLDGGATGDHGLNALRNQVDNSGKNKLVILAYPRGSSQLPVQKDQDDAFNAVLELMGVGKVDDSLLGDKNQLTIMGIPHSEAGVGWYTHGGGLADEMTGWLMPDASTNKSTGAVNFRFQPTRIPFKTAAASSATSNTIELGDSKLSAELPAGATGGFQVEKVDPIDFTPADKRAVFATNGGSDPAGQTAKMAQFLQDQEGNQFDMVVQSIGTVKAPAVGTKGWNEWTNVAVALSKYGANPDTFNRIDGRYAFFGGPQLTRSAVAQSSTAIVVDPDAAPDRTRQSGTLNGLARMQPDGAVAPVVADAASPFDDQLYDVVFQKATPWPHTAPGTPDAAQYAAALAYITQHLPDMTDYGNNVREAYTNQNIDWAAQSLALQNMEYPSKHHDLCPSKQGPKSSAALNTAADSGKDNGFTYEQFCSVHDELVDEFRHVAATKKLFDNYTAVLQQATADNTAGLETIGRQIKDDVEAGDNDSILSSSLSFVERLIGMIPEVGEGPAKILGLLSSAYEMGTAIAGANDKPVGDQIDTKVVELGADLSSKLSATEDAMYRLWQVVVTDPRRLDELGKLAPTKGWAFDPPSVKADIVTASGAYFSSELLPVAFFPWYLHPGVTNSQPTPDSCNTDVGHTFRGAPKSAVIDFEGPVPPSDANHDNGTWPHTLVIGRKALSISRFAYADAGVTDKIFGPPSRDVPKLGPGYGLNGSQWVWENYKEIPDKKCGGL